MSLPVLIGFAGVLVAAVATGMLGGRCVRQPRIDYIAWTAATFGLTVALAVQSIGFASGFGSATFRAVQLFALLLAPLWLAWGLAELAARREAARFAVRLAVGALTAVGGVILITDPLTSQPFGKSWPVAGLHYQPVSHYVLDLVQLLAVGTAVASIGLAAVRARSDPQWFAALTGIAPVGVAVLLAVALRFSLPARSAYPLLAMMAAALVWFGVTRLQDLPGPSGQGGRASGGYAPGDRYEANGHAHPRQRAGEWPDRDADGSGPAGPDPRGRPQAPYETQPPAAPGATAALAGADGEFGRPAKPSGPPSGRPSGSPAGKPARPYGRIVIFTLLEDRVADFDRLAEQTAEEVRTGEPDTLVYVIHLVPNAPMQRIYYEIYRDRAAFDDHESQPYMQRFVAARRSCVLATNVIELRLKYAKVAPLPHLQPAGPAEPPGPQPGPPAQLPPRQSAALPPVPSGRPEAWSPGQQVRTLEPLPPGPGPEWRRQPSPGRRYDGT
jgi:quinol monooxygenase YgiN